MYLRILLEVSPYAFTAHPGFPFTAWDILPEKSFGRCSCPHRLSFQFDFSAMGVLGSFSSAVVANRAHGEPAQRGQALTETLISVP